VELLSRPSQHVLVVVEHARDSTGTLYRFHRHGGAWRRSGSPQPAVVGAGGVDKAREGDRRAPSGVYALPTAFGYAAEAPAELRMPYLPLRPETECVDDAASPHYNRIVNPSELPAGRAWSSSEMMRRDLHAGDDLYQLGVVVAYNPAGERDAATGMGAGSCIFIHIWRGPNQPTVGCTAVPEEAMVTLLQWLDRTAAPVLVQGTRADLEALWRAGRLPYPVPPRTAGGG
jgi:L,D-peptidoglycan transpeptidase YkuD (ErfK/YbiS/YcfS/YnhG family)